MIFFSWPLSSYSSSLPLPVPVLPIFLLFSILYHFSFHLPTLSYFLPSVPKNLFPQNCHPSLATTQSFHTVLIFMSSLLNACFPIAPRFGCWFVPPVRPQLFYRSNQIREKSTFWNGFSGVLSMSRRSGSVCKFFSREAFELSSLHFLLRPIIHRPNQWFPSLRIREVPPHFYFKDLKWIKKYFLNWVLQSDLR